MRTKELLERFKEIAHVTDEDVDVYFPLGDAAIRVRLKNRKELVLTYTNGRRWRLETRESFINGVRRW